MREFSGRFREPRDGSELIAIHWQRAPPGFEVARVGIIPEQEFQASISLMP